MDLNTAAPSPTDAPGGEPEALPPAFTLSDEAASQFLQFKAGDEITATVHLIITDQADGSVSFEVGDIENPVLESDNEAEPAEGGAPAPEPDEDADEEKVLGFKRPKTKKDAPKLSAKDLAD